MERTLSDGLISGLRSHDDARLIQFTAAISPGYGHFTKWTASLDRLQTVGPADSLYLSVAGQWANRNLDASQQLVEGGIYTVRAYDMGALSADTGYLETAEWRHDLGVAWQGRWQALAFVDTAQLTVNKHPWEAGKNFATLSGAGMGLNWTGPHRWSVKSAVAARLGATPTLAAGASAVRTWIELAKTF
jgi:hemolysin activation/secretion protein